MNMPHPNSSNSIDQVGNIMLVIGDTPGSNWHHTVPLFERAGFVLALPIAFEESQKWGRNKAVHRSLDISGLHSSSQSQIFYLSGADQLDLSVLLTAEGIKGHPDFWLKEFPSSNLLMFYTRPEIPLVSVMKAGQPIKEMLNRWAARAELLLQFCRQDRCNVGLVDVDEVMRSPVDFIENLKDFFRLSSSSILTIDAQDFSTNCRGIEYLIASQMVAQSDFLTDLIDELKSYSLMSKNYSTPVFVDCEKIYNDLMLRENYNQSVKAERDEYSALLFERERKLIQLEHDYRYVSNQVVLVKELNQFNQHQIDIEERRVKVLESMQVDLLRENDLLLLALHQAQEKLESYRLLLKLKDSRIESMGIRIMLRENRLGYMEGSRSWSFTSPFRMVMRWIRQFF